MVSAIRIHGLRELDAAFAAADRAEQKHLRVGLAEAAEPVERDAERLARERISRIGEAWPAMRIGVTSRLVYVAPRQRARSGNPLLKRPNLATLLLGRAMTPALEQNADEVERRLGHVLDTVGRVWEAV